MMFIADKAVVLGFAIMAVWTDARYMYIFAQLGFACLNIGAAAISAYTAYISMVRRHAQALIFFLETKTKPHEK